VPSLVEDEEDDGSFNIDETDDDSMEIESDVEIVEVGSSDIGLVYGDTEAASVAETDDNRMRSR